MLAGSRSSALNRLKALAGVAIAVAFSLPGPPLVLLPPALLFGLWQGMTLKQLRGLIYTPDGADVPLLNVVVIP